MVVTIEIQVRLVGFCRSSCAALVPYQEEMEKRITATDTGQAKEGAGFSEGISLRRGSRSRALMTIGTLLPM